MDFKMKFLLSILLFNIGVCIGQTKVEYEKKVDESEIPSQAKQDLYGSLQEDVKVRWFMQKDGKKKVYEAKFDYKGSYYSVEFDLDGEIENVEVLLDLNDMETSVYDKITASLNEAFSDFKILKIQKEYIGDEEELFAIIQGKPIDDIDINYEVEINAKHNKRRKLYEVILDEDYDIISKRKIKLQSTDVLDY